MKLTRAMKRMFRAELLRREEERHFQEIVIPARVKQIERDMTTLVREWAPGTTVTWEMEKTPDSH